MNNNQPQIHGKTSPYGFFVKMCFEEHKRRFPDEIIRIADISKRCADKWKIMTTDEKKSFYTLGALDIARYDSEVAAYGLQRTIDKKRKQKDPNAPKRPATAFFCFSKEHRKDVQKAHPEWRSVQVSQELGKRWKSMTEKEKQVYFEQAKEEKARYVEEMKVYTATMSASNQPQLCPIKPELPFENEYRMSPEIKPCEVKPEIYSPNFMMDQHLGTENYQYNYEKPATVPKDMESVNDQYDYMKTLPREMNMETYQHDYMKAFHPNGYMKPEIDVISKDDDEDGYQPQFLRCDKDLLFKDMDSDFLLPFPMIYDYRDL